MRATRTHARFVLQIFRVKDIEKTKVVLRPKSKLTWTETKVLLRPKPKYNPYAKDTRRRGAGGARPCQD